MFTNAKNYAILKKRQLAEFHVAFSNKEKSSKNVNYIIIMFLLLFFGAFNGSIAKASDDKTIKFDKYENLLKYAEKDNDVYYSYKTKIPEFDGKVIDNSIVLMNDGTARVYNANNFIEEETGLYTLDFASTTQDIFFTELEKTVEPKTLFDKMISFLTFQEVYAVSSSTPYSESGDGIAQYNSSQLTWPNLRSAGGTGFDYTSTQYAVQVYTGPIINQFGRLDRVVLNFNTSSLSDDITITEAYLKLYETGGGSQGFMTTDQFKLNVCDVNTTATSSLQAADYNTFSNIEFSDLDVAPTLSASYMSFQLNQDGIDNINLTGYTQFGVKWSPDFSDIPPSWTSNTASYVQVRFSEYTGVDYDPYLLIYYDAAPATSTPPEETLGSDFFPVEDYNGIDLSYMYQKIYTYGTSSNPISAEFRYTYIPFFQFLTIILFIFLAIVLIWITYYVLNKKR